MQEEASAWRRVKTATVNALRKRLKKRVLEMEGGPITPTGHKRKGTLVGLPSIRNSTKRGAGVDSQGNGRRGGNSL